MGSGRADGVPDRIPERLTRATLEALRDRTLHRLPGLRVRGETSALQFIRRVGFCFAFSTFGYPIPCLWVAVCGRRHPRWPTHTHTDPAVGLTWELKDLLPAKRLAYYGRLLKGKPTLVSPDILPAFITLHREGRRSGDYLADYRDGRLTRAALGILDALLEDHPLETAALRRRAGLSAPSQTAVFERAMTELQRKLWVVKTEEIYEPTFTYRWDLLDHWWPGPVRHAEALSREAAVGQVLARYLAVVIASPERMMAHLFDLPPREVEEALGRLADEGAILRGVPIPGLAGRWVTWRSGRSGLAPPPRRQRPGGRLAKTRGKGYP